MVNQKEFEEDFEKKFGIKYKDYVSKVGKSLKIGRVPEQYKQRFKEIAEQEFCGDYGMLLRELVRTYDCIYVSPNSEVESKLNILADEVNALKQDINLIKAKIEKKEEEADVVGVAASGRVVRRGGLIPK